MISLRRTWKTQLILEYICEGLSSYNSKDSLDYMHGLAVYVNEIFPFTQDLSLENSAGSYL